MKIECIKEKILDAVSKAERFTGRNATLPTLSGILLEASEGELKIKATNLDLGVEISIPCKVLKEGKVLVPGTPFLQFLSHVRGEKNVVLELKNDVLSFSSQLEDVKFKTLSHEDFPVIPRTQTSSILSIDANLLSSGLKGAAFAASPSSMKPELSSVYLYGEGENGVCVGTDSFRLAEKKVKLKDSFDGAILIPFKNVTELSRILDSMHGKVDLGISKNQISLEADGVYVVSRTVEGSYPDYRQIIPKEPTTEIVCLREDLEDVLRAASPFTDRFHQITFEVDPKQKQFSISSRSQDTGELTEKIEAAISGDPITIHFNHKYVSDGLQAVTGDSVSISLNGAGKPAILKGVGDQNFLYVMMPMNR